MSTVEEMFAQAKAFHQGGQLGQAESLYHQILQADPQHADAHHLLGLLAFQSSRFDLAVASIRRALALNPEVGAYHSSIGLAHQGLGQIDEALAHFQESLRLEPASANNLRNVGKALQFKGRLEEAIEHFQKALRIQPTSAGAHNSLAIALLRIGDPDDAAVHCEEAIRLKPDYVEAHNNLGTARKQQGRFDEALGCFEQALRLRPDYGVAHWNRSTLRLLRGEFEQGWPEYEWRWVMYGFAARQFPRSRWDGSDLQGKTLLLYAEQGLGDTMQFIRYVPWARRQGKLGSCKVIVECQPSMVGLLDGVEGIDFLVARGAPLPDFDTQAPLLSLPGIFRTGLDTIPAPVPYLRANSELVEHWRKELARSDIGRGLKIGIAWQGSPENPGDRQRSIPLSHFARLAEVEGVRLISLQKGPGVQPKPEPFPLLELGSLVDEAAGAFMDTAAIMQSLDLVICCDTAVAHLAGAMSVPVWVALALAPDWRWLLERSDSPWYPSMRLFRQTRQGDWHKVFERMAKALSQMNRH
jgi:tetratricopeptide (TPR) repeat protein